MALHVTINGAIKRRAAIAGRLEHEQDPLQTDQEELPVNQVCSILAQRALFNRAEEIEFMLEQFTEDGAQTENLRED